MGDQLKLKVLEKRYHEHSWSTKADDDGNCCLHKYTHSIYGSLRVTQRKQSYHVSNHQLFHHRLNSFARLSERDGLRTSRTEGKEGGSLYAPPQIQQQPRDPPHQPLPLWHPDHAPCILSYSSLSATGSTTTTSSPSTRNSHCVLPRP